MLSDITISNKLYVMPGNKLLVPGCEPTSTITTTRMAFEGFCGPDGVSPELPPPSDTPYGKVTELIANPYLDPERRCVCKSALIDLKTALEIIPGSKVIFLDNYGTLGTTQKLFALPPVGLGCPCQSYEDYYKMLRDASHEATPEEEREMMLQGTIHDCYDGGWAN